MAPKGSLSTRLNPMRLNTINHLRVRRPNQNEQNPCVVVMSSMLNVEYLESRNCEWFTDNIALQTDCWASAGYGAEGCAALEAQLRKCMDAPKSREQKKNTVNYHLMRMYPKVVGPRKKDGVLG
ncbi:Ribosomal protein MRP10, mitochondrial [Penicillium griseofulvum]|uniref:Ribosomal protein MRP10, mitochondrial n=1 Tax=Penicillium patulum TaxID=5078 RepID=A0A135LXD8_PENPA|nr:Ribosomal protein MRP10, mitochondrial [Penicillium griseofulvum]KXG53605.1 Ribosomal protein MRP10, mitochondrial [Penicillium griseofulvum]